MSRILKYNKQLKKAHDCLKKTKMKHIYIYIYFLKKAKNELVKKKKNWEINLKLKIELNTVYFTKFAVVKLTLLYCLLEYFCT